MSGFHTFSICIVICFSKFLFHSYLYLMAVCMLQWIKCLLSFRGCEDPAHQRPNWQNTSSSENNQSWLNRILCKAESKKLFFYNFVHLPSRPGSGFCLQPAFLYSISSFFRTQFSRGLSKAIQKCRPLPGQKTSAVGRVLNCSKMLLPRPVFFKLRPT